MLESPTKAMFAENVNSTFHLLHGDGQPLTLELIECREGIVSPDSELFSLLFRGPKAALPQRTYEVEHPALGRFPLFLVPIKQDDNGTYYESVFNRLVRQKAG
jgi:hypothetical protein